jgi:photosystem II stability/assembly factor-like uncharacterized protein
MRVQITSALLLAALAAHATDVKHFERLEYRFIGPANMGGRTADVEGVPGVPGIVYAGTGGSGLWKTTNGGTTWTPLWEKHSTYSVGDIALDPRNPEVIWVGSGEANMRNSVSFGDGVHQSTDGGKTWKHLGLKETEHIARVLVSPADSNTAWVCAVGHQAAPNPERGVFLTTDGGATWTKTLYLDDKHGCADLDVNPANPNVLYAAMWRFERSPWNHTSGSEQSGIFRSVDGGRTWNKLTNGLPKLLGRAGVKVAPSQPETVYIACESKEGTFYRSTNAGENWHEMTRNREVVSRGFYYADLRVDPKDENRVYAIATSLMVSIDAGRTWRTISNRTHSDYHGLWIDPQDPNRIWQANDGGIAVSYDRGETWETVNNLPLGQFYQVHADNRAPFYNVTGGLQDNGTWTGPSRVRENSGILNSHFSIVSFGDGFYAYTHPDDPDLFITESQGGALVLSHYKSGEQQSIAPQAKRGFVNELKYRFNWNSPIAGSPHSKNTVYVGSNHLFQSRDFGKSWEPISPDLTTNNPEKLKPAGGPVWYDNSTAENHCTIISIGESPRKPGLVWVGTDDGNVQVTRDGGKTWTNVARSVPGVPEGSPVSHVEPSRTSDDTAYIAFDRHLLDDYAPHIFKTTDGGKTWTRLVDGLPAKAYVHIVREDPKNTNLLYAGTELGLFVSFDGGKKWQPMSFKNLPPVAVHDIVIHPRENDLILGTHGRSIVILDDITPLQQMTPEIASKNAHLFAPRHAWRYASPMRTYGGGNKLYSGPNPPYGALLTYYLKEKLDPKAVLKLEILDSAGKVLKSVERLTRDAGINRVAWDLREEGPTFRTPPEPRLVEMGFAGSRGPQALPGTYTARLTVNSETFEQKVEVRLDPSLKATPKELELQQTTARRVRDMMSSLNTGLRRMDALKAQLREIEKNGKEAQPKQAADITKAVDGMVKEIDEVSGKLAVKIGGSRLEDPPRLSEAIGGLFTAVSGGNSAPTSAQLAYLEELAPQHRQGMEAINGLLAKAQKEWLPQLQKLGLSLLPAAAPVTQ